MEDIVWIILSRLKGLGIKKLIRIYELFPQMRVEDLSNDNFIKELSKFYYDQQVIDSLKEIKYVMLLEEKARDFIEFHKKFDIEVIPYSSEKYPIQLKFIKDPPMVLYCKGNIDALRKTDNVAVVGTRKPSDMGVKIAEKVSISFAERDFTIVSGLALGIDTIAHKAALKANQTTIAVMAGSLQKIYPKENTILAEKILSNKGLLVSESPIGSTILKSAFVKRDRIQSGLSIGVCPIQTDVNGGTMHTIRYAHEQNRLLFTPKILEPEGLPVYGGIMEAINKYGALILETTEDYEKLITLMRHKYRDQIYKTLETKNSIKPTITKKSVEQISLFESSYSVPTVSFNNEISSLIHEIVEVARKNNLDKQTVLDEMSRVWRS